METHADKTQKNKNQWLSNNPSHKKSDTNAAFQFADNRSEAITQRSLQEMANNRVQVKQAAQLQAIANNSIQKQGIEEEELLQGKFTTIQKQGLEEDELLQGKFESIQKQGIEEEELLQGKFESVQMVEEEDELLQGKFKTTQKQEINEDELMQENFEPVQKKENNTGLPDNLKSGIENLSGYSMDDVKVHYNSDKPAQLNAHAYAQGTDIHIASGQEKHLPHEAWHVVQQKQGRVKPTMQMKGGVNVNDDKGLEKEADEIGAKALQISDADQAMKMPNSDAKILQLLEGERWETQGEQAIQRAIGFEFEDSSWKPWERVTAQQFAGVAAVANAPKNHVRGVARQQVIHSGTGWEMQGDDTPGNGSANMEAVTDPFPETPAGRDALVVAIAEIQQIYATLNGLIGRTGPVAPGGGIIGALNNYAIPGEHPFAGGPGLGPYELYMSGGAQDGRIKMQATTGIPLDRIASQFRMFGLDQAGVAGGAPDTHQPLREIYRGNNQAAQDNPAIRLLGGVPAIGEAAALAIAGDPLLNALEQAEFNGGPNAPKMVGFLTILALMIKTLNLAIGEAAKYRMSLLIRNRVSAVWQRLDLAQQVILTAHPALLRTHLLPEINAVALYTPAHAPNEHRAVGNPLVRPDRIWDPNNPIARIDRPAIVRMAGYTVGMFLDQAAIGADDLTPIAIDTWLAANTPDNPGERAESSDVLESFGAFGTDNDRVLFENRNMAPQGEGVDLTIGQASQTAFDYFEYVKSHP